MVLFKKNPTIIGMIPARYGSTRFPGKPLAKIAGKTLIQHTFENAKNFKELSEIVVATDDSRIAEHVIHFGGKVVMTSPECLTGTDRLAEVVRSHTEYQNADYILNIQGDEPCVNPKLISELCQLIVSDPSAVMATAVVPIADKEEALNPSVTKCVIDKHQNALYFSRSLIPGNLSNSYDPKIIYYRHIGVYCYTKDFLLHYANLSPTPLQETESLEQLRVLEHGFRIKVAIVSEQMLSPAVDHPEDIQKIENYLCKNTSLSQVE